MQIFLNFCAPCDKRAQCVRACGEGECFVLGGCCYENIWEILNLNDPRVRGAAVWGGGGAGGWQVRSTQLTLTVRIYLLSDFPISCSDNESTSNYIASNLHIFFLIVQLSQTTSITLP